MPLKNPVAKTQFNTGLSGKRVFNTKIGEVGIVTAVEQVENSVVASVIKFELGVDFEQRAFDAIKLAEIQNVAFKTSGDRFHALHQTLSWKVEMPQNFIKGMNLKEIQSRFEIAA